MNRLAQLRQSLARQGAEAMFISSPANVRYLSGFKTPEDGKVVVLPDGAKLLTDSRYTTQAGEESRLPVVVGDTQLETVAELTRGLRLAVESDHLSLKQYLALKKLVDADLVPLDNALASQRQVKDETELAALREAARITDIAYQAALVFMREGVKEVEVALELERVMKSQGAERTSFEIIVASGARGAMPHGTASQKRLEAGELVTLDFGARFDGYHADMTRTVAIGEVSAEARRLFDVVLEAQLASLAQVAPGKTGREVDAVARDLLAGHGLAEAFVHSLGHGTGLQIHEGPRLHQKSDDVLVPGMIVTVEPGVYLPGFTGLRIEDLVLVTEAGCEVLSHSPKGFVSL